MPYYLDNAFLLDNPWITVVGCGGTGGFVAEGLCRLFQGTQGHHRPGRPRPGGAPQPAAPELLRRGCREVQEPGPCRPAGQGLPASRRLLGLRLPGGGLPRRWGSATPAFPPTGTACSSAAPTTPPHGRAMAESLPGDPRRWLIDAGNDTNWGQVLVGNVADEVHLGRTTPSSARPATCCPRPRCSAPTC